MLTKTSSKRYRQFERWFSHFFHIERAIHLAKEIPDNAQF